jgi:hypothetical protein
VCENIFATLSILLQNTQDYTLNKSNNKKLRKFFSLTGLRCASCVVSVALRLPAVCCVLCALYLSFLQAASMDRLCVSVSVILLVFGGRLCGVAGM